MNCIECTLSDQELLDRCFQQIHALNEQPNGSAWKRSYPINAEEDSDRLFAEVCRRYRNLLTRCNPLEFPSSSSYKNDDQSHFQPLTHLYPGQECFLFYQETIFKVVISGKYFSRNGPCIWVDCHRDELVPFEEMSVLREELYAFVPQLTN